MQWEINHIKINYGSLWINMYVGFFSLDLKDV